MGIFGRVSDWTGWELDGQQLLLLRRYADWLVSEAIPAGGLGPNEGERVIERHVADALLFSAGWSPPGPPTRVVDLGSGVGLPGIPLAILWGDAEVILIERSGRRADLLRRAARVLGLANVAVRAEDAARVELEADLVVARAAADPGLVFEWGARLIRPGGRIVIGGSHVEPPVPMEGEVIRAVPAGILDHPAWLRMMAPS
ncbi:MAG TPA: RsmG family class I SAM-dependent methyltransferase [Acidimicrobiia bacterium]|nr:RsmG family class I SAM-dependent methyltransferase [Acidimicrobiia bacterium]